MAKHDALRAFLVEALPELGRNPESLLIYLTGGRVQGRFAPNLGFGYRARLAVDVLGFPGDPAQFFLPLVLWLRLHEPALLQNHEKADELIQFEVDLLDQGRVDISVNFPINEAVDVLPVEGGYQLTLREEPPTEDAPLIDPAALLKRIFDRDGTLIVGTPLP